jgi:hypothetical protein
MTSRPAIDQMGPEFKKNQGRYPKTSPEQWLRNSALRFVSGAECIRWPPRYRATCQAVFRRNLKWLLGTAPSAHHPCWSQHNFMCVHLWNASLGTKNIRLIEFGTTYLQLLSVRIGYNKKTTSEINNDVLKIGNKCGIQNVSTTSSANSQTIRPAINWRGPCCLITPSVHHIKWSQNVNSTHILYYDTL